MQHMPKLLDWSVLVAYCGLIFLLSAQEQLPVPEVFDFQDKLLHVGAYFVMAIISWRAFRHWGLSGEALAWSALVFCSLYGLSDEWHQSFVLGRSSSVWDWVADSVGAATAVFVAPKYYR